MLFVQSKKCVWFLINCLIVCISTSTATLHVHWQERYASVGGEMSAAQGGIEVEPYHAATVQPTMQKRDATPAYSYDKAAYTFNGLERIESVPVLFPIDICLMSCNGSRYATALHMNKAGMRHFAVFRMQNNTYRTLLDVATPHAVAMDCRAFAERGFVALAYNLTQPVTNARAGAPIYKISGDRVRAVQYFADKHMVSVNLRIVGNELMLWQTFRNTAAATSAPHLLKCPCLVWSGSTFKRLGSIPCSNARHLEPFAMDYESYVAVANFADQRGRTTTHSEVYKFNKEQRRYQLFQRITTHGAVDVRFFSVPFDAVRRQHFLVFGNTLGGRGSGSGSVGDADSIFYVFEKGQFVPYQRLSLYAVEQFLPMENADAEKFLLFVAQSNQHVRIYNLNDWKFEESAIQFTEGALSRGVAQMRVYQGAMGATESEELSYLVIANERMSEMETNVFRPIFKQEEHANTLRQQIIDWAEATTERLRHIDVEQLQRDVATKRERLQASTRTLNLNVTDIPTSNIQTVLTKSLTYPRLRMNAKYWLALSYANRALDALLPETQRTRREMPPQGMALEREDLTLDTLHVLGKLRAKRVNGIDVARPEFASITAAKVVVAGSYNNTNATTINTTTTTRHSNDTLVVERLDELHVQNLQLGGKLNAMTLDALVNGTLKRFAGQQTLAATLQCAELHATAVRVLDGALNGQPIDQLVRIDGGNYTVAQRDLRFAAPLRVDQLWVHERLNNLRVRAQRQFDVLLRRANHTQVVAGAKHFDSIRVLEPITASGPMVGRHLRAISPIRAVHEDVVLHGDFTISGDVHIEGLLQAQELIDEPSNRTVSAVLRNALRWREPIDGVHLQFAQALVANDCDVSYVNRIDLQHLARLNWAMPQVVDAAKTFVGDLTIHEGFGEVRYLNGVDVEALEQQLLLRDTNQTIAVPVHIGRMVARSVRAPHISLNGTDLNRYLTTTTAQTIDAPLKVQQLHTHTLNTGDLNANGMIFGQTTNAIYEQKSHNAPHPNFFQRNRKFHGTLHVKNLVTAMSGGGDDGDDDGGDGGTDDVGGGDVSDTVTINDRPVAHIERQLAKLRGDIVYMGNCKFNYDLHIGNLSFGGALNGVPARDFGHSWLQRDGVQIFTAPQSIAVVNAPAGVRLNGGMLNGVPFDDFYTKTIWCNRAEHMGDVYFENPIQMLGKLNAATVNGLRVPEDMLYRHSTQPQVLEAAVVLHGDLHFEQEGGGGGGGGALWNTTTLNDIDLNDLAYFLNNNNNHYQNTLHVEHATFTETPTIRTLNRYDLQQTLNDVWLANANVELPPNVAIATVNVENALLELKDHHRINNMDVTYLLENYFSLSRPQDIDVDLIFEDDVRFDGDFTAQHMHLMEGSTIMESTSKTVFNFEDLVYHTLKTSGEHTITAQWHIDEVELAGDLHGVRMNNLNFVNDVLLLKTNHQHVTPIIANKNIESAMVDALYASSTSRVNGVNVAHWLRDGVLVNRGNQTIRGTTTLDSVQITEDLRVDGRVNNVSFNAETLLLRDCDQTINGELRIRSKFPLKQRVLTNNINRLHTTRINDWNVTEFLENKANMSPDLEIQGHLIFQQPVMARTIHQHYDLDVNGADEHGIWKRNGDHNESAPTTTAKDDAASLANAVSKLNKTVTSQFYRFDRLQLLQRLPATNATHLVQLHLRSSTDDQHFNVLGVEQQQQHNASIDRYTFYAWNNTERRYKTNKVLKWLPQEKLLLQLLKIWPKDQKDNTSLIDANTIQRLQSLREQLGLANTTEVLIERLQLQNGSSNRFVFYDKSPTGGEVRTYCCTHNDTQETLHCRVVSKIQRANVEQLLPLSNQHLALRLVDGIEIWNTNQKGHMLQRLNLPHVKHMSSVVWHDAIFLAIATMERNQGTIEIHTSNDNRANHSIFQHIQTLECTKPFQLAFSPITQTDDLLLHVLSDSEAQQSLQTYEYKGVLGFQHREEKITSHLQTASKVRHMQSISLQGDQLQKPEKVIALIEAEQITLVDVVVRAL